MKIQKMKKSAVIFLIGYFVLFTIRSIYMFSAPDEQNNRFITQNALVNSSVTEKKAKNNYASTRTVVVAGETAKSVSVDQKYERIGFLTSETNRFDEDGNKIRDVIKENKAIVQFEDNTGVKGNSSLELSMGVHPDKFDVFVDQLKVVANLVDFKVQKTDKTSEYKDLKAKQSTMEKYKESLVKLKDKGGSINELIALENKILEVEEKIQGFGVQLGDFNQENELCTVKLTLRENMGIVKKDNAGLFYIAKMLVKAFVWSLGYYFLLLVLIMLGALSGYALLVIFIKAKKIFEDLKAKGMEESKTQTGLDE